MNCRKKRMLRKNIFYKILEDYIELKRRETKFTDNLK